MNANENIKKAISILEEELKVISDSSEKSAIPTEDLRSLDKLKVLVRQLETEMVYKDYKAGISREGIAAKYRCGKNRVNIIVRVKGYL